MGKYSEETKLAVVKDYVSGTADLKVVARRHDVEVTSLRKWVAGYRSHGPAAFAARVVMVDVSDPKSGSMKIIDALRARFPAASIVAISGYFHAGPAMAGSVARQLGVDRALAKSFGCSELVEAVKALLGQQAIG
ncbi:transposase-like protein [Paraburkholderia sp. CI2]|uniref:transposase n=1 Tax=Paraburkholderia sp. CI2 TaxID=2723093 RepID=UPI00161EC5E1|nr:transposase [Paraburkholderia sp. CI2]MBB5464982.1 transposase-like protein [Paraburkholderia sp. CI2]